MHTLLGRTQIFQNLADSLLLPKKSLYQEEFLIIKLTSLPHIIHKNKIVKNISNQGLKTTVFHHRGVNKFKCAIIFLHGYGSNRLQGLSLLNCLPEDYIFCSFDFSGSGKSEGTQTTYGLKQSQDIQPILQMMSQNYQIDQFVLWGRSMGAVSSLLYTSKTNKKFKISYQVLDSPFSSFKQIALEWSEKYYKFPSILIKFGLQIIDKKWQNKQYNPFKIVIDSVVKDCKTPSLLIYSEEDSIINHQNSVRIIDSLKKYGCKFEKIIIQQNHNCSRKIQTLENVFQKIHKKMTIINIKIKQKLTLFRKDDLQINNQEIIKNHPHKKKYLTNKKDINITQIKEISKIHKNTHTTHKRGINEVICSKVAELGLTKRTQIHCCLGTQRKINKKKSLNSSGNVHEPCSKYPTSPDSQSLKETSRNYNEKPNNQNLNFSSY